jgi:hypothetical protein
MNGTNRVEVRRSEDGELLGFLADLDSPKGTWRPLTIFGNELGPASDAASARSVVLRRGLECLTGKWSFYSKEYGSWYSCTLLEVSPKKARVYVADENYPVHAYSVTIESPTPDTLRMSE